MAKRGPKPKTEKITEEVKAQMSNMTPEQVAIAQRAAAESDDWKTITEADMEDFSLMENPFKLPPPAQKMVDEKKFKFRWAECKPQRIDYLRNLPVPQKWWVCNRDQTPFLKEYVDPVVGAIIKNEQILLFQPYWMYEKYHAILADMSEQQTAQGEVHKRDGIQEPDKGIEWKAGPDQKIGNKDEVVEDVEAYDREMSGEPAESGLEDIIEEEE